MSKRKDRERAEKGLVYRNGQLIPMSSKKQPAQVDKAIEIRLEQLRRPTKYQIKRQEGKMPLPD